MRAIEALRREHALVRKLLRCLGALTLETRATGFLDEAVARRLLRVLERFVDWAHQDKEELQLFPHLLARASREEAIYLEGLFGEHAQERRRLVGMIMHMDGACRGRTASVERFVTNALLYERLQARHLEAEEEVLLPLAEAILAPEDDRRILRGFREIDRRLGAPQAVDAEVEALCQRLGVTDEPVMRVPGEILA